MDFPRAKGLLVRIKAEDTAVRLDQRLNSSANKARQVFYSSEMGEASRFCLHLMRGSRCSEGFLAQIRRRSRCPKGLGFLPAIGWKL